MSLALILPEERHKIAVEAFKQEFFDHGEHTIYGSALLDQMNYDEWLINTRKNARIETVRSDWVVATTFLVFEMPAARLVGIVDIRHSLDNAFLAEYGGHIGYAVRPTERRKGHATSMLLLALKQAGEFGLKKVMLGCYSDNVGSIKTIEKCGGIFEKTKPFADGKPMNVYWIDLERRP